MKNITKRLLALVLAVLLVGALSATAYAAPEAAEPPIKGTISVERADGVGNWSNPFKLYRLFDATVGFDENGDFADAISYTCTDAQKEIPGFSTYFSADANNTVSITEAAVGDDGYLSAAAVKWIKDNIDKLGTLVNVRYGTHATLPYVQYYGQEKVVYGNLPFGYYFLDSTVGAAVMINSTTPDAEIKDKNELPGMEKTITKLTDDDGRVHNSDIQMAEDPGHWWNRNELGNRSATVQIGDTVQYTVHITAKKGAQAYVFFDGMTQGLTLDPSSIVITKTAPGESGTPLVEGTEYTLFADSSMLGLSQTGNSTDGYVHTVSKQGSDGSSVTLGTFTLPYSAYSYMTNIIVVFDQENYLDKLTGDEDLYLTYNAVVNASAQVAWDMPGGQSSGNENNARLAYGRNGNSIYDRTRVFSARLKVFKYEGDGDSSSSSGSIPLNGVEFVVRRDDGKYFSQDEETMVVNWVDDIDDATVLVSGADMVPEGGDVQHYWYSIYDPGEVTSEPIDPTSLDPDYWNYNNSYWGTVATEGEGYVEYSYYTIYCDYDSEGNPSAFRYVPNGTEKRYLDDDGNVVRVHVSYFNGYTNVVGTYTPGADGLWGTGDEEFTDDIAPGSGSVTVNGLTNGHYTLIETKPLPGYNPAQDTPFVIDNKHDTYEELRVQLSVANKTGSVLPATGGMGVMAFELFGGLLMIGAAALLLKRKARKA